LGLVFAALAGACLALAAFSDVRAFRIPNIYPALLILLFLGARMLWGFSFDDWWHLLHFAIALIVGMLLFKFGWVGGGDAKLYAGAAIWFSGTNAAMLIFATGIAGLLLAIVYLLKRKLRRSDQQVPKKDRRIPYGLAIAIGALVVGAALGPERLVSGDGPVKEITKFEDMATGK
jgi:prepilin peptidase CpaA